MIVVGACVLLRETLEWFENKPLFGKRVLILRPLSQTLSVVSRLIELGAQPILAPTIEILPPADWQEVDRVLARVDEFDWIIFTSVNGVFPACDTRGLARHAGASHHPDPPCAMTSVTPIGAGQRHFLTGRRLHLTDRSGAMRLNDFMHLARSVPVPVPVPDPQGLRGVQR